ncbi:hypothetical protein HRbin26_00696 [bacterium HR26]|nr:hypothetical protein HRbin26_00696 [bacterium HR26]
MRRGYIVIDNHIHYWDASPENCNEYGHRWIKCFHAYHKAMTPSDEYLWDLEFFRKVPEDWWMRTLFDESGVDVAILQPTHLMDFFHRGFNTVEQNAEVWRKAPDRLILNGRVDPRDGEAAIEELHRQKEQYGIKGLKLYTAEWHKGSPQGWRADSPEAMSLYEECEKLGVKNLHFHKGPGIDPLTLDGFDVGDIDGAAVAFPRLNFIVDHVGLPNLDKFCWIAVKQPNVYAGLSVAVAFGGKRKRYFAETMANLLYWLGEDRIMFGSDFYIWHPKWEIDVIIDFQMPEDLAQEYGVTVTETTKRKILAENSARLYGIDLEPIRQRAAETLAA